MYTDGITESMNEKSEEYGLGNLKRSFEKHSLTDPSSLLKLIIAEVNTFCNKTEQHDDMTMIAIKFK